MAVLHCVGEGAASRSQKLSLLCQKVVLVSFVVFMLVGGAKVGLCLELLVLLLEYFPEWGDGLAASCLVEERLAEHGVLELDLVIWTCL